jgi:hypothetical protein
MPAGVMQLFCPENAPVSRFISVVWFWFKEKGPGIQPGPYYQESCFKATISQMD